MRPTGIGYRSPRERTPAYYTTNVSISVRSLEFEIPVSSNPINDVFYVSNTLLSFWLLADEPQDE